MTSTQITDSTDAQASWARSPVHVFATVIPIVVLLIAIGFPAYFWFAPDWEAHVTQTRVDFVHDGKVIGQSRQQLEQRFGKGSTNPEFPNESWYELGGNGFMSMSWYTLSVVFDPATGNAVSCELHWNG